MPQVTCRMANSLRSNLDLLAVWGNYRLKTLWKGKGSTTDPSKYRGLSIGSTVCKLIINIILVRIRPWYEAQPNIESEKTTFISVICRTSAAFDHIPKKWLFDAIRICAPEGENCSKFWENSAKKHLLLTRRLK